MYTRDANGTTVRRKRKSGPQNNPASSSVVGGKRNRTIQEAFNMVNDVERAAKSKSKDGPPRKQLTIESSFKKHDQYRERYKEIVGTNFYDDLRESRDDLGEPSGTKTTSYPAEQVSNDIIVLLHHLKSYSV